MEFHFKSDDESAHGKDPIDMSKLSEQIARSASMALVSFLDLLATNGMTNHLPIFTHIQFIQNI